MVEMLYSFVCGAAHHQEDDEVSTPRKSNRKRDSKNPYSECGLDEFSALLAELEEKKKKIYSKIGSQSLVRFVYKNSNDCVPIVVKLKDKQEEETKPVSPKDQPQPQPKPKPRPQTQPQPQPERSVAEAVNKQPTPSSEPDKKIEEKRKSFSDKKKSFSWNVKSSQNWRRPCYHVPVVIILILVFLVFFGRSVAIMFTCVGWYIVPTISGEDSNMRTSMKKKKDYGRKLSGNKLLSGKLSPPSPRASSNRFEALRVKSPRTPRQCDSRKF